MKYRNKVMNLIFDVCILKYRFFRWHNNAATSKRRAYGNVFSGDKARKASFSPFFAVDSADKCPLVLAPDGACMCRDECVVQAVKRCAPMGVACGGRTRSSAFLGKK